MVRAEYWRYNVTDRRRIQAREICRELIDVGMPEDWEGPSPFLSQAIRRFRMPSQGFVYFIQPVDGGLIKIGTSTELERRFTDIQMACPIRLAVLGVIPGGRDLEIILHAAFSWWRMHGEWFEPSRFILETIERFCMTLDEWKEQEEIKRLNRRMSTS